MAEERDQRIREIYRAALEKWNALPEDERNGERPWIMGWNAGYEHAQGELASPPVPEDRMVEEVARALCVYRKEDPDEMVQVGDPIGNPADYPQWMLGMPEARAVVAALQSSRSQVEIADLRCALRSALDGLHPDSTPIIRRLARIKCKHALSPITEAP